MAIKKATYQYCHCFGKKVMTKTTKFFCYKILDDGTCMDFNIYSTQIDSIIYCNCDNGYDTHTYIRVNGEYQYYDILDDEFLHFIVAVDKRTEIFELLRNRYSYANITIIEDSNICVYNNRMVEHTYDKGC